MNAKDVIRALVQNAYENGWRDACSDHMAQIKNASYPIGEGKADDVDDVLSALDPNDLLDLRSRGTR